MLAIRLLQFTAAIKKRLGFVGQICDQICVNEAEEPRLGTDPTSKGLIVPFV